MAWTIKRWDHSAPMMERDEQGHDYVHVEVDSDGDVCIERDVAGWGPVVTYVPRPALLQLFAEHDAYLARAVAGSKGDADA